MESPRDRSVLLNGYPLSAVGGIHLRGLDARLMGWSNPAPAHTTRGRWGSSRLGSGLMGTAWTIWSGCAGLGASFARVVATSEAGAWGMAGSSAPNAVPAPPRQQAPSSTGRARL